MTQEKQQFKVLPSGDVEGSVEYGSNKVTIKVSGVEQEIGEAPSYVVKQIIKKDRIPTLVAYLQEQLDYIKQRVKSSKDVLDKTEAVDIDKLAGAFDSFPADKKGFKKFEALNRMVEEYYMKSGAIKNMVILEENQKKIEEQIKFLTNLI